MAEEGSDRPASVLSRYANSGIIARQMTQEGTPTKRRDLMDISRRLSDELYSRGIKGFKRGGRVHRTGIYKLHRGERVVPARSRRGRRR